MPAPGPLLAGGPPGDAGAEGPPLPLLGGLRQRMLAHIFLTRLRRGGSSPRRQQAELRWFYRSVDLYCSLVAWRVGGWGVLQPGLVSWRVGDWGREGGRAGTRPHQVEDPHHVIWEAAGQPFHLDQLWKLLKKKGGP